MSPPTGSCKKDAGKSPYPAENTENCWKVETVFLPEIALIFPMDSCQLLVFFRRNWPEIMENFRSNTASTKSPE